jgi:hypothetical protein
MTGGVVYTDGKMDPPGPMEQKRIVGSSMDKIAFPIHSGVQALRDVGIAEEEVLEAIRKEDLE